LAEGKSWVVDLDIEKLFDRVNHGVLMVLVARKVQVKRMLSLIRRCFFCRHHARRISRAGPGGIAAGRISALLLSNILLDEL
jgi:RNA-directed DNA polymerase